VQDAAFPVYALAKDSGEVMEFPSLRAMQAYMEPIDVENDEYGAWDRDGYLLRLSVTEPKSAWLHIVKTEGQANEQEFSRLKGRAKVHLEPEPLLRSLRRKFGLVKG
jgi:hypothetical protein